MIHCPIVSGGLCEKAAASLRQAKVMFWSRNGTERIRLPVAAK
jgi:hypothetical protein